MLLDFLMGVVVFLSAASFIALSATLIEGWIQRHEQRDPDYRLALGILRWVCLAGWIMNVVLNLNYIWRFITGLTGSTLPGPISNSIISMLSFVATFGFLLLVGVVSLYLLWESIEPSEKELDRRRRMAQSKIAAERRRRQQRDAQNRLRRGW